MRSAGNFHRVGTTVRHDQAVSANIEGKRLALAHLVFNLVTATVALTVMPLFLIIVDQLAIWMDIKPDSYALKLALFHTVFNLAGLAIMVPLISPLALMLEARVKSRLAVSKPRHINEQMLATPGAALEAVRLELLRLLGRLFKLIARTIGFEPAQLKRHGDRDADDTARHSGPLMWNSSTGTGSSLCNGFSLPYSGPRIPLGATGVFAPVQSRAH